ncbi:MAG: hypothetical protein OXI83_13665, partial [Gemmatimonadota bacterium]|nr:hypothetical protein [Gemmatimonadota bacterium]
MRRMDTLFSGLAAARPGAVKRPLPRPALPLAALVLAAALACQYEAPAAGDAAGAAVSAASSSAADPISAAELVDLTAAVGGTHPPRWSPDGSRITFVSGGDLGSVSTEDGAFE